MRTRPCACTPEQLSLIHANPGTARTNHLSDVTSINISGRQEHKNAKQLLALAYQMYSHLLFDIALPGERQRNHGENERVDRRNHQRVSAVDGNQRALA